MANQAIIEVEKIKGVGQSGEHIELLVDAEGHTDAVLTLPKAHLRAALPHIHALLAGGTVDTALRSSKASIFFSDDLQTALLRFDLEGSGQALPIELGRSGLLALRDALDEALGAAPKPTISH
jgi:hypothetical protein